MKILFMGTPDYAAGALQALIDGGHEITAVVTQPDKPKGRSSELVPSPVKVCALENHIPVLQPRRIKAAEAIEELKKYPADVYVVAAFGQIISQEILDMPQYGCINIHASLLPKYRGASPIQNVILDGEDKTGITIMQMDAGIDTGDILYQKEIFIDEEDTFETLHDKLTVLGGAAITEAIALLERGELTPVKQDDSMSCYVTRIDKSMGKIDFSKSAVVIDRLIRGMNPWPSAFTSYKGKQLKIWKAKPLNLSTDGYKVGEVMAVDKESVTVATAEGALKLLELQLEGKKRMTAHDFLLGVKMAVGEILG